MHGWKRAYHLDNFNRLVMQFTPCWIDTIQLYKMHIYRSREHYIQVTIGQRIKTHRVPGIVALRLAVVDSLKSHHTRTLEECKYLDHMQPSSLHMDSCLNERRSYENMTFYFKHKHESLFYLLMSVSRITIWRIALGDGDLLKFISKYEAMFDRIR